VCDERAVIDAAAGTAPRAMLNPPEDV